MDLLTGYYWQSEARSRLQFYFLLAVANAVVLIVWALYNKLRFQKKRSIMPPTNIHRKNMQRALAIPDELYQQLQKAIDNVHFTAGANKNHCQKSARAGINYQNKARFARALHR
ncbi:poly-beta-1,6-N-acetyl-D-glucosamine biosynthesis protein PgaD [Escherichia coli]